MTTSHGGDWNLEYPYDSLGAFQRAWENGADAVKGDFRVSGDNVGMVMHSSPIEWWESIPCHGKKVEEMAAKECEQCTMALTKQTFISVPTFLSFASDKINIMLCVKESRDIPRAIETVVENNATTRSFLELGTDDFLSVQTKNMPNWDKVYYVVELRSSDDITRILSSPQEISSRMLLAEFIDWENWGESLQNDINRVKAAGFRTFAATKSNFITATVENHLKIYFMGFDVAYTYNLENAVTARKQVNEKNGITPSR